MLTSRDKQNIYRSVKERFPESGVYLISAVSAWLIEQRLSHRDFGYQKFKELMLDFPELFEIVAGEEGKATLQVRLKDWEENVPAQEERIPCGELPDFCELPVKPVEILAAAAGVESGAVRAALAEDFKAAAQGGQIHFYDEKLLFPCRYKKEDGTPIEITLKPSSFESGRPWFLFYIDTRPQRSPRSAPGRQLEGFAFLGSWQSFLEELAQRALPEPWDFENSPRKNHFILQRYIQYTFYRLRLEEKICIFGAVEKGDPNAFAAFNTGLVDEHYDDIYACFTPNSEPQLALWKFEGFCVAGGRGLGKRLVECFNPLPEPAAYFRRKEDLLFDLDKTLLVDYQHIIIDNIARLPTGFLKEQFYGFPAAADCLEQLCSLDQAGRQAVYVQLQQQLEDQTKLFNRLRHRIEDAIELARKQVRWNFKTAIPSYYPSGNSMSLMLPLSLEEDSRVDTVLVVELTASGNYQGQTILTMQQAYIDARLLCRPNSEWLTTAHLSNQDAEEDTEL
ncbi:MAG: hypothetical protein DBX52_02765 [Clostridiales bacterium]|nr:MAG: hypothetical protein DBX52_02765 [Clostridiales bacterium]